MIDVLVVFINNKIYWLKRRKEQKMSDRVIIRQCIIPIIEEHLKDNLEPNTIKMYQQIITLI